MVFLLVPVQLCVRRRVWTEDGASGRTDAAAAQAGVDTTAPGDVAQNKTKSTLIWIWNVELLEKNRATWLMLSAPKYPKMFQIASFLFLQKIQLSYERL